MVDSVEASRTIRPVTAVCACAMAARVDVDVHVGPVYARGFRVVDVRAGGYEMKQTCVLGRAINLICTPLSRSLSSLKGDL